MVFPHVPAVLLGRDKKEREAREEKKEREEKRRGERREEMKER